MNGTRNCARPLKCRLCWRRFKYSACMNDHMRSDHKDTIMLLVHLRQAQRRAKEQLAFQQKVAEIIAASVEAKDAVKEPVRVSVIRQNTVDV